MHSSAQGAIKMPQTGWLIQQKFIFSLFWRLEVWDQDTSTVVFWWRLFLAWSSQHSLLYDASGLTRVHWCGEGEQVNLLVALLKDMNHIRTPPVWLHLTFISFLEAHLQIEPHWVLQFQYNEFLGDTNIHFIAEGKEIKEKPSN